VEKRHFEIFRRFGPKSPNFRPSQKTIKISDLGPWPKTQNPDPKNLKCPHDPAKGPKIAD
jgi:hypothetical protein